MVRKFIIDLSKACGYVDGEGEDKFIRAGLRKVGLFNKNCLYSVFNGERIRQVERTGNYREGNPSSIFAFKKGELIWNDGSAKDMRTYCQNYSLPAIVVYDARQFKESDRGLVYEYSFKNPDKKVDTLLGIGFFKD